MIRIKPGVEFTVIAPAGYLILDALKKASKKMAVDLTISSACDGAHSGPGDPHHTGRAMDIRSHDLSDDVKAKVVPAIFDALADGDAQPTSGGLATAHFFGFLEAANTSNEHFHVQQRKGADFTVEDFLAV